MDSPSVTQSHGRRDRDEGNDRRSDRDKDRDRDRDRDRGRDKERATDDAEWEETDKRKHRSSKSKKPNSSGDRHESRKRLSDEDDYDVIRDSRPKISKRKQEEGSLEKLSTWYQDGETESWQDGGTDKLGSRGHGGVGDDSDRRKPNSKMSESDTSQSRSKSKQDRHHDGETERSSDRDSKYLERRDSGRDKIHGSSDYAKTSRRRWDDHDVETQSREEESGYKNNDGKGNKAFDNKYQNAREKSSSARNEFGDSKIRGTDSVPDKSTRSNRMDEKRADGERPKSRGISDASVDYSKANQAAHEDLVKEKYGLTREESTLTRRDDCDGRDRSFHGDVDGTSWPKDRSSGRTHRSRTPDQDGRYTRDRPDNERARGRSGRKDGSRGEAVKTSSNFGISNDNYDVIEIQTKPLSFGRTEQGSNISRRHKAHHHSDAKLVPNDEEWRNTLEERRSVASGEDLKERYNEDDHQSSWKDDNAPYSVRGRGQNASTPVRAQSSSSNLQSSYGMQEPGSFNRGPIQGAKGNNKAGRGGRGRPVGRENQQLAMQLPMMGSPFVPIGMAHPGPLQSLNPGMTPAPGSHISPGAFVSPFTSPVVWPGARGIDVSMLGAPPSLSPIPPGPAGPRFPPNMAAPPSHASYYSQPGHGRGAPLSASGAGFSPMGTIGRGTSSEKSSGNWVPPRSGGPTQKAPSRGEQNDYSQNFVDTGMRPQNFIRELELTSVVEDYPKLRELIQKKDEIVAKSASPPMYHKCDLREFELSPEFFGTKFDVILVDPPWEEYVHRAPGVADHMEYWTFEEILNLKIEAIADIPSFIFLWVGDGVGLEQGRQCLKKWGFRRCEDICWVKTNKTNATPGLRHDSHTLFQHSKEHCLMGIKGTVRRSTDGHIIHANIDTDVIIAEEPPYGSTQKPEDMYRIIEHFALGRRRLELFGEDHNIRSGWLTAGKGLSSSNFNADAYTRNFADKDGKVWQGGSGRNPPPDAPHLVLTTPDIESLRPKSPMKNQQQNQSASISLTTSTSYGRRAAVMNSPQNHLPQPQNQEITSSNHLGHVPWGPPPMEGLEGPDGGGYHMEDRGFDMYRYNEGANGQFLDFDPHRGMNMM
ncbi:hypothetical protein SAY87_029162 [Trapa incisa]|uniref:Methyltransferase-like protein 1 n=1 Tax=Trapa incisa TaxID=236973 RepID=A0AAN7L121_9MYRT|nr:hypothetical protein SAY87_029162 [Trapa incisa]